MQSKERWRMVKISDDINIITKEIVEDVLELFKEKVYKIVLYGSYARGDFTKESDVDIMILLNCDKEEVKQYRKEISRLASRIGLKNDIEISLLLRDSIIGTVRRTFVIIILC